MTVQVSDRLSQLYVGNGVNTRFDFMFRAYEQEDETGVGVRIKVGNEFEFIDESEYTVTTNPDNMGGYVTFVNPPSAETFFYIAGKTPVDQLLDITNYDNFYPDALERALDKITAILQEWNHLVDFETQARILADIAYDDLAKQREADLKAYIDGIASAITGRPVLGLPSEFVVDGNDTQKQINDKTIRVFESVSELMGYTPRLNGQTVYVKSYRAGWAVEAVYRGPIGGGEFVFDSSRPDVNDGGLILNGWVRVLGTYITPEMFGAKGNAITDDYEALTKCFTALSPLPDTIYDANFEQYKSKSGTVMLSSVVYRHTKPLRLPAMMNVLSSGAINYFLDPSIVTNNNKPCFYYDGVDLEVAAVYLPIYLNNGDGTWSLNKDSMYIANAGDAAERSLSVGTKLRFNIITRRNTKLGINLFGHESGEAELGVGTMGTWSPDQTAAIAMQSQDYEYDDLSPRCGIYVRRAWNGKLIRPRVIAHKTGIFLGRHSAGYVVEQAYINRQLDKHTDALGLQSEFKPDGIPPSKNVTCGIVIDEFSGTLNNPVVEHWGVPYMITSSAVTLNKPHIEGSNLIMNHNFIVYGSKVEVNDWSGIRSMYEREGTSIVYSNGMSQAHGDFFKLKGAGYYADNSGFIIVDGSGFDPQYNGYFLCIEDIAHDKLVGIAWFTDSRYIKRVKYLGGILYPLYVDTTKTGIKKGFGVSFATALQGVEYVDEAIRLLGSQWNKNIELVSDVVISSDIGISANIDCLFNLRGKTLHANTASFLLNGNTNISFIGPGTLKATAANLFKNSSALKCDVKISTLGNVTFDTSNYLFECYAPFVNFELKIMNSNLTAAMGRYAIFGDSVGTANIFVKSSTRKTGYDSTPIEGSSVFVLSKFLN